MKNFFLIYGTVLCVILAYANYSGWVILDSFSGGKWGPRGRSFYHK